MNFYNIEEYYYYIKYIDFKNIKTERYFLVFVFLILLLIDEHYRKNTTTFILIVFFSCLSLFLNLPLLVTWTKSKPLYIEELFERIKL